MSFKMLFTSIFTLFSFLISLSGGADDKCIVKVELTLDSMLEVTNQEELCSCLKFNVPDKKIPHREPCNLETRTEGGKLAISAGSICKCAGYMRNSHKIIDHETNSTDYAATWPTSDAPDIATTAIPFTEITDTYFFKDDIKTSTEDGLRFIETTKIFGYKDKFVPTITTDETDALTTEIMDIRNISKHEIDIFINKIIDSEAEVTTSLSNATIDFPFIIESSTNKEHTSINSTAFVVVDFENTTISFPETNDTMINTKESKSITSKKEPEMSDNFTDTPFNSSYEDSKMRTTIRRLSIDIYDENYTDSAIEVYHDYDTPVTDLYDPSEFNPKERINSIKPAFPEETTLSIFGFRSNEAGYETETTTIISSGKKREELSITSKEIKENFLKVLIIVLIAILVTIIIIVVILKIIYKYTRRGSYVLPHTVERNMEMQSKC